MQYHSDKSLLRALRELEVRIVLDEIAARREGMANVLELGSGDGWQAMKIAALGHRVEAIDVAPARTLDAAPWQVRHYDGVRIPFEDASFDIIYSSNVLEHVARSEELHHEMLRVLRDDGFAIHILPSSAWRFWTWLTHYPNVLRILVRKVISYRQPAAGSERTVGGSHLGGFAPRAVLARRLRRLAYPERHGERGTTLTEIYHFRRTRWLLEFERWGWKVLAVSTNRIAYSGYLLFGDNLSLAIRRRVSGPCGAACNVFVVIKADKHRPCDVVGGSPPPFLDETAAISSHESEFNDD